MRRHVALDVAANPTSQSLTPFAQYALAASGAAVVVRLGNGATAVAEAVAYGLAHRDLGT